MVNVGALIAAGAAALVIGVLVARRSPRLWLAWTVAGGIAAVVAAALVLGSGVTWTCRTEMAVAGAPVEFRLDAISALFLALVGLLGAAGAAYSSAYWTDRVHPASAAAGRAWWSAIILGQGLVLVAANGLHFLVGWELFTVCAYFLITLDRARPSSREAGWLYLAVSHVSLVLMFIFFAAWAARTGSWQIGPALAQPDLAPLFWLALAAFTLKAGVFPLHVWLPSAHANAPSHVSAMLSGVSIKMGIYGIVRFSGWLPLPAGAGITVIVLGVLSAVLGVAFALGQHDLKRLLAYHSVENVGIILIGLGFGMLGIQRGGTAWGSLALAGGLLHVWNHGLFKSLLFLGAGSVLHGTGTREMSRLGGLWRRMPWTAGLFGLGAVAICGLPPLNGFVSEWLVYLGLIGAAISREPATWPAIAAVVLLAVTGALALACFIKACSVVFLGVPRTAAAARAHEAPWSMRAAMIGLALSCVAIGFAPAAFWPALDNAMAAWGPPLPDAPAPSLTALGFANVAVGAAAVIAATWLLGRVRHRAFRRAPTWDCGFAAPTPRMQYTTGSFAGIIVPWFAALLRPIRHDVAPEGLLPRAASHDVHVPETVLQFVVEPAGGAVLRAATAARGLQHGRVQSYLLYLLLGIGTVAAVVLQEAL